MTNEKQNPLDTKNFGPNLRRIRLERGITYEAFAEMVDVSTRLVYDYEDGFKTPRLETICRIAMVLEVSLDSLLR